MADNRQFADHAEIGGVSTYFEDKKLAESPSQTDVESTDYFVLKDTDGVPHKIVKSDVLEMVRDAMGTILANNNKGTSVAKVPTIGSSGNDLGSSSVADLASVLGVVQGVLSGASGAIDENVNTKIVGSYSVSTSASPFQTAGLILVLRRSDTCSQIFIGTGDCILGMRIGLINGNWNSWKQVAFNE